MYRGGGWAWAGQKSEAEEAASTDSSGTRVLVTRGGTWLMGSIATMTTRYTSLATTRTPDHLNVGMTMSLV